MELAGSGIFPIRVFCLALPRPKDTSETYPSCHVVAHHVRGAGLLPREKEQVSGAPAENVTSVVP